MSLQIGSFTYIRGKNLMTMNKIFVLLIAIFLMASCHRGKKQPNSEARAYHIRFNPPDSSTYRYNTTSDFLITVIGGEESFATHTTSRFTVNYLISKDSNDVVLEITFDKIDYHEVNGAGVHEVDAANTPGPVREILKQMKTADFFARVRPADLTLTLGGVQELVNTVTDAYYSEANRPQASDYWGQWAERELVWKNLDPLVWVALDSVRHPGDHWADTSTNLEQINFKINRYFQFDTVKAGMAMIRSQGRISNDKRGTWVLGKVVTGMLTGNESGKCLIDTATGMPGEMDDLIDVEGDVQIEGHKARIRVLKMITMMGGKVK